MYAGVLCDAQRAQNNTQNGNAQREEHRGDAEVLVAFLVRDAAVVQNENDGAVVGQGVKAERGEGHQTGDDSGVSAHRQNSFTNDRGGNAHAAVSRSGNAGDNCDSDDGVEVGVAKADHGQTLRDQLITGNGSNNGAEAGQGGGGDDDLRILHGFAQTAVEVGLQLFEEHNGDDNAAAEQRSVGRETENIQRDDNEQQGYEDQQRIGQIAFVHGRIQIFFIAGANFKVFSAGAAFFGLTIQIKDGADGHQTKANEAEQGGGQNRNAKGAAGNSVVQSGQTGQHTGSNRGTQDTSGDELTGQIGDLKQRHCNREDGENDNKGVHAGGSQNDVADDHGHNNVVGAELLEQIQRNGFAQTGRIQEFAEQSAGKEHRELGNNKASHAVHVSCAIAINDGHSAAKRYDQRTNGGQNNQVDRFNTAIDHYDNGSNNT